MIAYLRAQWSHRHAPRRPRGYESRHGAPDRVVEIVTAVRAHHERKVAEPPAEAVAPNAGEGAAEGWSPAAEVAGAPIAPELARNEEEREELEIAATRAELDAILDPILTPLAAAVDAAYAEALAQLGVSDDDIEAYRLELAAEAIVSTTHSDFGALRELVSAS